MNHDVFISYSSKDQKVVEALSHYLEERGIRCFIAYRDIPKGKVWATVITDAIENCKMMVVIFSKDFNISEQVDREIELCAEEKKPILTFRIQDEAFKGAKKYYLKNLNWIDAFPNPNECFQSLYESLTKLLNIEIEQKNKKEIISKSKPENNYSNQLRTQYLEKKSEKDTFLMPIEDIFHFNYKGAKVVITGCIKTGSCRTGEKLSIVGFDKLPIQVEIIGIEMGRKILDYAEAGDTVGLLLSGVDKRLIKRGMVIASPDSIFSYSSFVVAAYILKKEEGGPDTQIMNNDTLQFWLWRDCFNGVVRLHNPREIINPGDECSFIVNLIHPVPIQVGLQFAVRRNSKTIGGGVVSEINHYV